MNIKIILKTIAINLTGFFLFLAFFFISTMFIAFTFTYLQSSISPYIFEKAGDDLILTNLIGATILTGFLFIFYHDYDDPKEDRL